ncbi:hypothetical protein [Moorena sp. SIO4G3]|nr:hypothetical protein [Moorena sp. SIO4G3]
MGETPCSLAASLLPQGVTRRLKLRVDKDLSKRAQKRIELSGGQP